MELNRDPGRPRLVTGDENMYTEDKEGFTQRIEGLPLTLSLFGSDKLYVTMFANEGSVCVTANGQDNFLWRAPEHLDIYITNQRKEQ